MFTGIVQHVGTVKSVIGSPGGSRIVIDVGPLADGLKTSDSMAVNGVCLTVASVRHEIAEFDVIKETLRGTTTRKLESGCKVNLERSLVAGSGVDGHFVQGHIDGTAKVTKVERGTENRLEFSAPADITDTMVSKGSVAVDGVSLTLTDVGDGGFSVAMIPETMKNTILSSLSEQQEVNVETDILGKYIFKFLSGSVRNDKTLTNELSIDKLKRAGFA